MALRAREIYYFVRVGNYASRPLRALSADMGRLSHAGRSAAATLEMLEIRQRRLQSAIARRQLTTIPNITDRANLQLAERQAAIQKLNTQLALRRERTGIAISRTEYDIDAALARGNQLERERVTLEARLEASYRRQAASLALQRTELIGRQAQLGRAIEFQPQRIRIAELASFQARARQVAQLQRLRAGRENIETGRIIPGITPKQEAAALAGRISRSPRVAGLQAQFLSLEKAVQSSRLALAEAQATTQTLGERQAALSATSKRLTETERALNLTLTENANRLARADEAIVANDRSIAKYREDIQLLTRQLEVQLREEGRISAMERRLVADRLAAAEAIARENEALQIDVAELHRVAAAIDQVAVSQRRMHWDKVALGSRAIMDLGRTMQYAGGITIAVLGYMAHAAANFQTQATLAATQVTNNFKQIGPVTRQIMNGVVQQMQRFPATADEMTKASYDIYSSLTLQGNALQQTKEGLTILTAANKAAVAGMAPLPDVTNALVTILNQFGKAGKGAAVTVKDLPRFLNRAFAAVRFGRETFQEFTTTLANAAPAARAAHQSFTQMVGTLAFLTRRLPVRQAAVGYARLLEVIQRSAKGLHAHGIEVRNQAGFMRPLDTIIGEISRKFPKLAEGRRFIATFFKEITKGAGAGTQGTMQARRAFTFLVQQYQQAHHLLRQVAGDQNEFNKSYRALSRSPGMQFRVFINQLKALSLIIGQSAIPVLLRIVAPLRRAVQWFNNLSKAQKAHVTTTIAWIAVWVTVVGTGLLVLGMLGRLITMFGSFNKLMLGGVGTLALLVAALVAVEGPTNALDNLWKLWTRDTLTIIAGIGVMIGVVIKLTSALRTLAETEVAQRLVGLATGAETAGAALGGATIAGMGLGVALPIVGAGVALLAGGIYLMHRRADEARKRMEELSKAQQDFARFTTAATVAAHTFGNVGLGFRNLRSSVLDLQDILSQIHDARRQLRQATPSERPGDQRQLNRLYLERADAIDRVSQATDKYNKELQAGRNYLVDQIGLQTRAARYADRLRALFTIRNLAQQGQLFMPPEEAARRFGQYTASVLRYIQSFTDAPKALNNELRRTEGNLRDVVTGAANAGRALHASLITEIRQLQQANLLPQFRFDDSNVRRIREQINGTLRRGLTDRQLNVRIRTNLSQNVVNDAEELMRRMHRALSVRELRFLIRAEINPNTPPRGLQPWIARFIRKRQIIHVEAQLDRRRVQRAAIQRRVGTEVRQLHYREIHNLRIDPGRIDTRRMTREVLQQAGEAKKGIYRLFQAAPPIKPKIQVNAPEARIMRIVGRNMDAGIAQGIRNNVGIVNVAVHGVIDSAIAAAQKAQKSKSPSRRAADEIGKPWVQGIAQGIYQEAPTLYNNVSRLISRLQNVNLLPKVSFSDREVARVRNEIAGRLRRGLTDQQLNIRIHANMRQNIARDVIAIQRRLHRTLTARELRLFIRAEMNPNTTPPQIPRRIVDFIKRRHVVHIEAKLETQTLRRVAVTRQTRQLRFREVHNLRIDPGQIDNRRLRAVVIGQARSTLRGVNRLFQTVKPVVTPKVHAPEARIMRIVGRNMDAGIAEGVRNNVGIVNVAVRGVIDSAIVAAQRAQKSHSPSRRAADEIGKPWVQGIVLGIREESPALRAAARQAVSAQLFSGNILSNLKKHQLPRRGDLTADLLNQVRNLQRYRASLLALQRRGVPRGLLTQLASLGPDAARNIELLSRMTEPQLRHYVRLWEQYMALADGSVKKHGKSMADAMKQQISSAVSNMRQVYDQLQQQNQDTFGDITQGIRVQNDIQFGIAPRGRDMLADLRDMVRNFERYRRELDQLQRRGVPFPLIQQLEQAGVQAEPLVRGLLNMNRRQFHQYVRLFNRAQGDIRKATQSDFNMQLTDWRRHGRKAALAFMQGMGDERSYINKQMRAIFMNWLRGGNARLGNVPRQATHAARVHHQARRTRLQHNPRPIRTQPPYREHHHPRHLQSHRTTIHNTTINHNDKIEIADHGEDLSTKMRKARRHQKLRRMQQL